MAKNYNKTILQTSFTSLETIYYLLNVIKENGPYTYQEGKDIIFPKARARTENDAGGTWDESKPDTHAELTLREMNLIRYVEGCPDKSEVSDLGNEFLKSFRLIETPSEDGIHVRLALEDNVSVDEKNQLLFAILVRTVVQQERFGRKIRPYHILFKLLLEDDLDGYVSKQEWASFINDSSFLLDTQYDEIHQRILEVRKNNEDCALQKSDRILTRLAGWQVLDKIGIQGKTKIYFKLNEEFGRIVKLNMVQPPLNRAKKNLKHIAPIVKPFKLANDYIISDEICNLQVEIQKMNNQNIIVGDEVLFVDEEVKRLLLYNVYLIHQMRKDENKYDIDVEKRQKVNRAKENDIIRQLNWEEE